MTIHLNTRPDDRKDMVKAISEHTGLDSTYMGMPSCAYQIGAVTVNRDGTINYDPDATTENLIPMLIERGWLDAGEYDLGATDSSEAEAEADSETEAEGETESPEQTPAPPTGVTSMAVNIPLTDWTIPQLKNLLRLVCSKQNLIRRMTGNDTLYLSKHFTEAICAKSYQEAISDIQADLKAGMDRGEVSGLSFADDNFMMVFPYDEQNPTRWEAIGELMNGMMRMAKVATRVSLDSKETPENEKFYAHAWLVRMGYGGPDYKGFRAALLKHLKGYAAFKSEAEMQAHKDKYAAIRRERREPRADATDADSDGPSEAEPTVEVDS